MLPTTMQSTSLSCDNDVAIRTILTSVPFVSSFIHHDFAQSSNTVESSHHPQLLSSYDGESRDACNLMTTGFEWKQKSRCSAGGRARMPNATYGRLRGIMTVT
jgi:hypothetical protein